MPTISCKFMLLVYVIAARLRAELLVSLTGQLFKSYGNRVSYLAVGAGVKFLVSFGFWMLPKPRIDYAIFIQQEIPSYLKQDCRGGGLRGLNPSC